MAHDTMNSHDRDDMKAVLQERYGAHDVLRIGRAPVPTLGDDQVLIKVRAAGLDRGTEHLVAGKPYAVRLAFGMKRPRNPVPGRDAAGTVVEVGSSVTRFAPGDEVYGVAPGSFAEYAVAQDSRLALKPRNVSFTQAAAVPVSAATAMRALVESGRLRAGQSVLVLGASGGVGSYAVQLAKSMGAEVTGVCSAAKADLVRSMGADHVLDYSRQDFADGSARYDLILDISGNPTLRRLRRALQPRGTIVFVGGEGGGAVIGMGRQLRGMLLSLFVRQRMVLLATKERGSDYERLTELIEAGHVFPSLDSTFALEDAPLALRRLEQGHVRGKVVLRVR